MFPRPLLINKEVIFDNVSDNWRWWEGRTPFEQEAISHRDIASLREELQSAVTCLAGGRSA